MQSVVDHCQTASDVWAAVRAVHEKRMTLFARGQRRSQKPEPPIEPEPIEVPSILPVARWNGLVWIGDFALLVAAAYPKQYGERVDAESIIAWKPTVLEIIGRTAKLAGLRAADLISARRTGPLVLPRQVAMALAKHHTLKSLPEIGRRFGGRDHTTVLHAVRKMQPVIDAAKASVPEGATLDAWIDAALAFARANKLESCHERRERLARLKAPFVQAAE